MYRGTKVSGWMPEYFIEVTSRPNKSAFADAKDGGVLKKHLELASDWKEPSGFGIRDENYTQGIDHKLLFARGIQVPYGTLAWNIPVLGEAGGQSLPKCFTAISESMPETWRDDADSGDRELAAIWAPVSVACVTLAPVAGAIQTAKGAVTSMMGGFSNYKRDSNGCSWPMPAWLQKTKAFTGPSALDPSKLCMGALGPLLPRTGVSLVSDYFTATQQVAWRLASLSEEYLGNGIGIQASDKWQLVWPNIARPNCFTPGDINALTGRPTTAEPTTFLGDRTTGSLAVHSPGSDIPKDQGLSDAVFAIWRYRSKCIEPWDTADAYIDIPAAYYLRLAGCSAMNAADGMP